MVDPTETGSYPTRHVRRGVGALVCCLPVLLPVASIVHAGTGGDQAHPIAMVVLVIALLVGGFNFYLSLIRGLIYRRKNGSMDGYKHVSIIPVIGSFLIVVGTILGFGSALCAALGLFTVAIDTGGSVWFLAATWKDSSLWDR